MQVVTKIAMLLCASAPAMAMLRGTGHQSTQLLNSMRPEVVRQLLDTVEQKWIQTRAMVLANATDSEEGFAEMQKSCVKVSSSIVKGSDGEKDKVTDYMQDVCVHDKKGLCTSFASGIERVMSDDSEYNRDDLRLSLFCKKFWEGDVTAAAQDEAKERIAEQKAAEEAKKKEAEAEVDEEAKAKAAAEAERKTAEEAQAKAEAEAAAAAEAKATAATTTTTASPNATATTADALPQSNSTAVTAEAQTNSTAAQSNSTVAEPKSSVEQAGNASIAPAATDATANATSAVVAATSEKKINKTNMSALAIMKIRNVTAQTINKTKGEKSSKKDAIKK